MLHKSSQCQTALTICAQVIDNLYVLQYRTLEMLMPGWNIYSRKIIHTRMQVLEINLFTKSALNEASYK